MLIGRSIGWQENLPFVVLLSFLVLLFLMGGSSRADIQSLAILRPAAVLVCAFALTTVRLDQLKARRTLVGLMIGAFLLVGLYLVPLSPSLWSALPGRGLVHQIDVQAGLGEVWRPLSMVPSGTRNTFYSLFVPLAVLLLGVQLTREQLEKTALALLVIGLFSGMISLLQLIGPAQGPLYFYRITNSGGAVGLFANRNHQAVLLATLFPLLVLYSGRPAASPTRAKFRMWLAVGGGAFLVPLLLVTGSRAGLVLGVVAIAVSALLYRTPSVAAADRRRGDKRPPLLIWLGLGAGALGLILIAMLLSRAEALQRITKGDVGEDLRFGIWGPIFDLAKYYFPLGSGPGTFPNVYQITEPYAVLIPNYLNHAHNDWLELVMEMGLPGLLLASCAVAAYAVATVPLLRDRANRTASRQLALIGALILLIFAAGSFADYPIRTPAISGVVILAALWLTNGRSPVREAGPKPN
jgi:O-antigen ligase